LTADILDSSGNNRHGTACINGDAPFPVPGKFGNAGRFDGINQYANMGPGFNFTSSFTAAMWIALDDYDWCGPTGKSQHIIGTHHLATPAGNGRGWGIYWDCDGLAWELTNSTGSAIASYGFVEPSPFPDNGSWHHAALVYDSTVPSATLYWDGVPVYSESGTANVPSFLFNNGEPLTVNGLPYAPSSGAPGKIDDTRVYNSALSAAEIQTFFDNQPPVAVDDSYETDEDTSLNITAPGVLENDSDADGNPLTVVKVTDPASGTLNLNIDGSFTYIPNENYFGVDSFTYKANDGMWDSDVATVVIMVHPVNDPPTVSIIAPVDGSTFAEGDSIGFTGTASDVEDGNLSSSLSWSSNLDGSIGIGNSFSTSTLSVGAHTVTAVANDFGTLEGSDQITITVEDMTAPDTMMDSQPPDPSGADVTFTFSSPDSTATFECQLDNDGYADCTAPQNYTGLANGPHIFDVRAKDPAGNMDATPASYSWTVYVDSASTPQIHYVKWDATGANNGSSWTDAYTDLQAALSAASGGDEIWVAAGTYKPTSGTDRTISFELKNGVAVYGGFAGTETLLSQRDWETNVTILSGDLSNNDNDNIAYDEPTRTDNSYHVVVGSGTGNSAVLDGFTIKSGNANEGSDGRGGGMFNGRGDPNVRNVIFTRNSALLGGGMNNHDSVGGYPNIGSNPILNNVTFIDNSAVEGGGMENSEFSSPSLANVTFINNTAERSGGGLLNLNYCSPSLINVIFDGNTADVGGGMMNWNNSHPSLTKVVFNNNSAEWGGGMANSTSSPTLTDVVFSGNAAISHGFYPPSGGGMFNDDSSSPNLVNVTFNNNSAKFGGGMFIQSSSSPILENVTFAGNVAEEAGGGMIIRDNLSNPVLTNVTFNNNSASIGGGIDNGGSPVIRNTIIWGNTGGEIVNNGPGIPDVSYSIVQGGFAGTGNLDVDPLLDPLANNDGFTQTMALLPGSPAIDAGDDGACPATDQRGVTRPQGSHCDIGAYEYEPLISAAIVDVTISGNPHGPYTLAPGQEKREFYPASGGPVVVESTNGFDLIAAIRLQSMKSGTLLDYNETMGIPEGSLSTKYIFPVYENLWAPLNSQLRFAHLGAGTKTIKVTIGTETWTYDVAEGQDKRIFLDRSGGPVIVESLDGVTKIVAAIRLQAMSNNVLHAYSETFGIPIEDLSTRYYFPVYENKWAPLNSQLRFAHLGAGTKTIKVTIGTETWTYDVAAGEDKRIFLDRSGGPVIIESLDGVTKVIAAIRLQSMKSGTLLDYNETMGIPEGSLSTKYIFPVYENQWAPLNSQLRFAHLGAGTRTIKVTVGTETWTYDVAEGQDKRIFLDRSGGPVVVESLDGVTQIVAAIRLQCMKDGILNCYSETMGIPFEFLSDTYYFPVYENKWAPLNSQVRFGVP
jgi:hypothetical protein